VRYNAQAEKDNGGNRWRQSLMIPLADNPGLT